MTGALVGVGLTSVTASRPAVWPVRAEVPVAAARATAPVAHDPDDPSIWIHPTDPSRSLIVGTDKVAGTGGLYVFGLDGRIRQTISPLDRPNNVDVEYGLALGGWRVDIAVTTERKQHRLRVFAIRADGSGLDDLGPAGIPVLAGQSGEASEPMGIALYRRPRDGAIFAIVSPKAGGRTDYLWQYRLDDDGNGGVRGMLVRRFGDFSGVGPAPGQAGEIEAVAVDDARGFVYYADERFGIRKWAADPDAPDAAAELGCFGTDGYLGDREGLAIYAPPGGPGYLLSSDQVAGGSRLHVYDRDADPAAPRTHRRVAIIPTVADETDGIEAVGGALPGFPRGVIIMMNSTPRNFLLFDAAAVFRRAAVESDAGRGR